LSTLAPPIPAERYQAFFTQMRQNQKTQRGTIGDIVDDNQAQFFVNQPTTAVPA
jgi:hypothetical protein